MSILPAAGVLLLAWLLMVPVSARAAAGWSAPVKIDSHPLADISCVPGFCAAVDLSGNATVFRGGAWSAPAKIDDGTGLLSVSCTSATFCESVELGSSSSTALIWNGTSWASTALPNAAVEDVSCASAQFCVAVGPGVIQGGFGGNPSAGNVDTYQNGTWTPAGAGQIDNGRTIDGVSCVAQPSIFCAAVDQDGNALTYSNGSWSEPVEIDGMAPIQAVTCASSSLCFATDNQRGTVSVFDGANWSAFSLVDGVPLGPISCASTTFCMGLSANNTYIYDGNSWSAAAAAPAGTDALSCPVAGACVGVTNQGDYATYPSSSTSSGPPSGGGKPAQLTVGRATARGATTSIAISCTTAAPCAGTITETTQVRKRSGRRTKTVTETLAKASYSLAAGSHETVALTLHGNARRAVSKHKKIRVKVVVALGTGKSAQTIVTRSLIL